MGLLSRKEQQPRVSTSPCAHLRAAYHDCFNRWYSEKYLKGQWDKEECVSEWGVLLKSPGRLFGMEVVLMEFMLMVQ
ncbi:uncharacterized protein At4g33100 isoform X5 [Amborella trichopoda]|uniref:uncharacterized protein At4g33100 isoform X5 n=1 Tax=Amborella trichopoda TaxID=13333 RepID=UPI0009BE6CF9|nr:uncharacterized protein At4g33100 isoform X5 [Amborella trichopoda]|eukprot:XP_020522155.1 uncharacterized protein At4g33100 isoform X5 [Amborella trichopoda]